MYPLTVWKTSLAANGCWYFLLLFSVLKRKYQVYWQNALWVMLVNDHDDYAGEEMLGYDFHDMPVNPLSCNCVTLEICFLESIVHASWRSCKQDFGLAHSSGWETRSLHLKLCSSDRNVSVSFMLVLMSYLVRRSTAGLYVFSILRLALGLFQCLTTWSHIGHSVKACPNMQLSLSSTL